MKLARSNLDLLISILLIVGAGSGVIATLTSDGGAAGINISDVRIEPPVLDLGSIGEGQHDVAFSVVNESPFAVDIVEVSRTCSCTNVLLPTGPIAPGGRVEGSLQWDVAEEDGPASSAFTVVLSSHGRSMDDVREPGGAALFEVAGLLRADVRPWWRVEPSVLTFTLDGSGNNRHISESGSVRPLMLIPVAEQGVRITGARISRDDFSARVAESGDRVLVTARNPNILPHTRARLTVFTDSKHRKFATIPIRVR